jgi:hypothetical protein
MPSAKSRNTVAKLAKRLSLSNWTLLITNIPGTHVLPITSFIGAVISILIAHFFKGIFKGKPKPAKA